MEDIDMKKPDYDWEWLTSHAPFKKIFKDMFDLQIEKEVIAYCISGTIPSSKNQYNIKIDFGEVSNNFENLKRQLLNTRVCKHNESISKWVNEMTGTSGQICELIIQGCICNASGSFKWIDKGSL